MTNDSNWTKTKIYYLVIGHACDEESAWLYLDFEEEKTNDFLEKKFTEFVLEELGYDPDIDNYPPETDDDYEPTDNEVMSSFGTKWHDWL